MSLEVSVNESNITILRENMKDVVKELCKLNKEHSDWFLENFNFENIDLNNFTHSYGEEFEQYSLEDFFYECLCLELKEDINNNYVINNIRYDVIDHEDDILNAIAKYCKEGSYMELSRVDGELFRLVIENGKCIDKYPTIIWE